MPDDLIFESDTLILDACCVITLSASGVFDTLLEVLPVQLAVAKYVLTDEALTYYAGPERGDDTRITIDLQPYIDAGTVDLVDLDSSDEQLAFLGFAQDLDDGEAMTGAIAAHRGYALATDDKKGLRMMSAQAPQVQLVTTPDLLHYWAHHTQASADAVGQVLWNTRYKAVYTPPRQHPLYEWWHTFLPEP